MGKGDHDPLPIVQLSKVPVRKEKKFKFWSNKDNDGEVDESWQVRFPCMRFPQLSMSHLVKHKQELQVSSSFDWERMHQLTLKRNSLSPPSL